MNRITSPLGRSLSPATVGRACPRPPALVPVLLLLLLSLSGCTRAPQPTLSPTSSTTFPLTLTDAQSVSVTVPAKPQRIVSVSPAVTEMLFAIGAGDRVVAVTDQCNYPPEVKHLRKVGLWFTPSAEKALAARPDLVLGQQGNPPEFIGALRKSGCSVFTVIEPKELAAVYPQLRQLGQLTGASEGAERVIADLQQRLAAVQQKLAGVPERKRPAVFIILQLSPIWTAGEGTFQDDAIRAAGARNVGRRVKGFKEFSNESLLVANPDFLLVATMGGNPEKVKRQVRSNPVLRRLTATRENHIVMLNDDVMMRAGPRIVNGIEALAQAFYPDRFSSSDTKSR